ncbi:sugar phosphate isomerase/epimerase family protein [Burkholderia sp. 22PA0099]|uniref:sugar phosphate isomerase/epimerase family protein n=1 Tax=Burkholderia sp. 22PA0099 TaxID=3237372 RepID=UPI0039C2E505
MTMRAGGAALQPLTLDRCSINTATLGHREPLAVTIDRIARAGFGGIAPWRHELDAAHAPAIAAQIRALGLAVTGYCRSTYFPAATEAERRANIEANRRALDQAALLEAHCFVLVVGGLGETGRDLAGARSQVRDGIASLLDHAQQAGVPLAIEPLHPMYAADRSVVNTLAQALSICRELEPEGARWLGVAADIYHCWWDPMLEASIDEAGAAGRLLAFHLSDWLRDTRDMLLDRGMMGDGVVDLAGIRRQVEAAGYRGLAEVEIFSRDRWWRQAPDDVLRRCADALVSVC